MKQTKQKLRLAFYLKKNEVKSDNTCPLMGRLTVGRTMVQFSVKMLIPLNLWDTTFGRCKGKSKEAESINQRLDQIHVLINTHFKAILEIKESTTAEEVKNAFLGMASQQETLVTYFQKHNDNFSKRVGVNREACTCFEYQNSLRHLKNFLLHKYKMTDIPFSALDESFINAYDFYLRVELKRKPNTILGITTRLRKMIKYAICEGIIIADPFMNYTPERPKAKQRYLTRAELDKIMNTPLDHPNRYLARDMFLFACFTGLAYRDMCNLSQEDLHQASDGTIWIKTTRQKTGTPCEIPLLELPLQIIEKYKSLAPEGKLLLMLSCKRMNINLQKIGKICGIERHLVFHMGRHTYASEITLSRGVPIETVSRMLGHRDLRSTRIYAKITNDKINEDMINLENRIADKYKLAE